MVIAAAVGATALGACSDPDGRAVTTGPAPTVTSRPATAGPSGGSGGAAAGEPGEPPAEPAAPTTAAPLPPPPPPETGVPGLDSDDVFCAAWSRYAGSFQVIAVASSFLVDDPRRAFEIELAGSTTVVGAYADLFAHWPTELEPDRATAEQVFGPFAARAADTASLLDAAGATPDDVAAIEEAWLVALANRNPEEPDVELPLDAARAELVATAADTMYATRGPLSLDPALATEVEPTLTYDYLAQNCPDEGLLAGADAT